MNMRFTARLQIVNAQGLVVFYTEGWPALDNYRLIFSVPLGEDHPSDPDRMLVYNGFQYSPIIQIVKKNLMLRETLTDIHTEEH